MKNTKFNPHWFIPRLIVSPAVFFILFVAHNVFVLKRFYHFLKFGGEYVNFEENERKTINDIFNELKKQNQERKDIL